MTKYIANLNSNIFQTPDASTSAPKSPSNVPVRTDPRPAKKMPDNPEKMNPLMLMNQMLPSAEWEDLGKTGNPPNMIFLFKVTIDGQTFSGSGKFNRYTL